jgi:hypothetical protein
MKRAIGVICIVVSVLMLVWAQDMAKSVASQVQKAVTGAPPDRVMHLYLASAISGLFGLFLVFTKGK